VLVVGTEGFLSKFASVVEWLVVQADFASLFFG
jgi:hypothetical protein